MSTIDTQSLVQILAAYTGTSEEEASKFLEAFASVVASNVKNGEDVEVQGLGNFAQIDTEHAEMRRVALILSESIKAEVNAPFSFLEPFVISKGQVPETITEEVGTEIQEDEAVAEEVLLEQPESEEEKEEVQDNIQEPETVAEEVLSDNIEEKTIKQEVLIEKPEEKTVVEEVGTEKPEVRNVIVELQSEEVKLEIEKEKKIIDKINSEKVPDRKKSHFRPYVYLISVCVLLFTGIFLLWKYSDSLFGNKKTETAVFVDKNKNKVAQSAKLDDEKLKNEREKALADSINKAKEDSLQKVYLDSIAQVRKDSILKAEKEALKKEQIKETVQNEKVSHRMKDESGNFKTHKLEPGERLTLVALQYFGHKDFWPYIFDVNSDKLKSPSNVMSGMTLYLPDPSYFNIDVNDEQSLKKARQHGHDLLTK